MFKDTLVEAQINGTTKKLTSQHGQNQSSTYVVASVLCSMRLSPSRPSYQSEVHAVSKVEVEMHEISVQM